MIPAWNELLCLRCAACVGSCPAEAILLRDSGISINEERCTYCKTCIRLCPVGALEERG